MTAAAERVEGRQAAEKGEFELRACSSRECSSAGVMPGASAGIPSIGPTELPWGWRKLNRSHE